MNPESGRYSIVQYCPSPERAEGVNVGVLLFSPAHRFIRAKFAENFKRPRRLFAKDGLYDQEGLKASRIALEQRLISDADSFRSPADLERFVSSRATDLRLTQPRSIKVFEPQRDLDELFQEIVGGGQEKVVGDAVRCEPVFPELESLFGTLHEQGRARLNEPIIIPVLEREVLVPYSYQNGTRNLVLTQCFRANEKRSLDAASLLAIEGDLLQRHPGDDGPRKIIVASAFVADANPSLESRVRRALDEYRVEMVAATDLAGFIRRVQNDAHAIQVIRS
ncbi:MAG: DUF3037 domain-containing protein [Pirellulaceae bacterium]